MKKELIEIIKDINSTLQELTDRIEILEEEIKKIKKK